MLDVYFSFVHLVANSLNRQRDQDQMRDYALVGTHRGYQIPLDAWQLVQNPSVLPESPPLLRNSPLRAWRSIRGRLLAVRTDRCSANKDLNGK